MFYTFQQNNSGGRFRGPQYVCVEANSLQEAEERFDELDLDRSYCECCGPRWPTAWDEDELTETPTVYGEPLESRQGEWLVYYLNGEMRSNLQVPEGE